MKSKYITEKEVAKELDISIRTVQSWRRKDRYLSFVKVGRHIRYLRSDVEDLLEYGSDPSTSIKKAANINYANLAKISFEKLISLPIEKLLEFEQQAILELKEAQGIKDWISRIVAIHNKSKNNNEHNINFGGVNEQVTDYI